MLILLTLALLNTLCATLLLCFYPVNLQFFSWKHVFSIGVENSVDPDQMASSEGIWSGSTVFSKKDKSRFSRTRDKFNPFYSDEYPINIDTISVELSILYFKRLPIKISIKWCIPVFMPPTSKKLKGHIALGLYVHVCPLQKLSYSFEIS